MPKKDSSKQELSDVLNQILGTHIKWDKLSTAELKEIYGLISNPPDLARRLAQSEVVRRIQNRVGMAGETAIDFVMGFLNRGEKL